MGGWGSRVLNLVWSSGFRLHFGSFWALHIFLHLSWDCKPDGTVDVADTVQSLCKYSAARHLHRICWLAIYLLSQPAGLVTLDLLSEASRICHHPSKDFLNPASMAGFVAGQTPWNKCDGTGTKKILREKWRTITSGISLPSKLQIFAPKLYLWFPPLKKKLENGLANKKTSDAIQLKAVQ